MKARLGVVLLLTVCWAMPAMSQGCAMCYSNAAATTKSGQRALSRAVAVLLVPPLAFMTVGMGLAFRYSKKRDSATDQENRRTSSDSDEGV